MRRAAQASVALATSEPSNPTITWPAITASGRPRPALKLARRARRALRMLIRRAHEQDGTVPCDACHPQPLRSRLLGERFVAVERGGAFRNGVRITVAQREVGDPLVALSDFAFGRKHRDTNELRFAVIEELVRRSMRLRLHGSVALDLAWLAAGRISATVALSNLPWDVSAGVLLVREAGGLVFDADGAPHAAESSSTLAAMPALRETLVSVITAVADDHVAPAALLLAALLQHLEGLADARCRSRGGCCGGRGLSWHTQDWTMRDERSAGGPRGCAPAGACAARPVVVNRERGPARPACGARWAERRAQPAGRDSGAAACGRR
jgi:hypothetical protein